MRLSPLLRYSAGLAVLPVAAALIAPPAWARNVLVVILDDVGADKVGSYQSTMYGSTTPTYLPETPTLDHLGDIGLQFTNVWANPVCSPSRASLLTGRYPYQHDVSRTVNGTSPELPTTEVTAAEVLGSSTWTSSTPEVATFGKWHLGPTTPAGTNWYADGEYHDTPNPSLHGFEAFYGYLDGEPENYYDWQMVRYPETLSDLSTGATVDTVTDYAGEATVTDAVDWIGSRTGSWVAYVNLTAAHTDDETSSSSYESNDLPPGWGCDDLDGSGGACSPREIFAELVEYGDYQVDQLLGQLAAMDPDILEDTLVIVAGDNGSPEVAIEGPWLAGGERTTYGKSSVWESGVRVPLFMVRGCDWMDADDGSDDGRYGGSALACTGTSIPMVTPGLDVSARTQIEDLFATVISAEGSTYTPPSTSIDLMPCLSATGSSASNCGNSTMTTRRMYTEQYRRDWSATTNWGTTGVALAGTAAVKRGNYKLTITLQGSGTRLCGRYRYVDLGTDPYETNDLLTGGDVMTSQQTSNYTQLKSYLRTTLAPDWLPARTCT
jgi:hypothetical protein